MCSGEINDTNYIDSVFYATSSNTSYSQEDLIIARSHYQRLNGEDLSRPAGNMDSSLNEDDHDTDRFIPGYWNE